MAIIKLIVPSVFLAFLCLSATSTVYCAGTPQQRGDYARKYKNYYDRIQVGASAKAEGKTLHIYLKYELDDFVVSAARRYFDEWKALGFTKVIIQDAQKNWSQSLI